MDDSLKRRLTGAVVLVSLAVIFVPMLVEEEPVLSPRIRESNIPVRPPSVMIDPDSRRPVAESAKAAASATPALPLPEAVSPPADNAPSPVSAEAPPEAPKTESPAPRTAEPAPPAKPAEPAKTPVIAKPAKAPSAPPKSTAKAPSGWVVQVGSFADKGNAEKTLARLRQNGYDSFMEEVKVGNKSLYRVRVGPEVEKKRAESLNTQIAGKMNLKGQVLRYP